MSGAPGPMRIEKVRLMNDRLPVSHPFRKNAYPNGATCPDAAPGDIGDGYQPSKDAPSARPGHGLIMGNCELRISCGTVQSWRSRLVAVEKYHAACPCGAERHTKTRRKMLSES